MHKYFPNDAINQFCKAKMSAVLRHGNNQFTITFIQFNLSAKI